MRNDEQTQNSAKESRTRYGPHSRYEIETGGDLESNDRTGSMKNFPSAFIPMEELEEVLSE